MSLAEVLAAGVPQETAPFVVLSRDMAIRYGHDPPLDFWAYVFRVLEEDSNAPWEIVLDLATGELAVKYLGIPGAILDHLRRYKPWLSESTRRAYELAVEQLEEAGEFDVEPRAEEEPHFLKLSTHDMYLFLHILPRRLLGNYLSRATGKRWAAWLFGTPLREPPLKLEQVLGLVDSLGKKVPLQSTEEAAV
ncbi:hypothetical protein ACFLX9_02680 [Chloroflexota bacterium]